MKGRTHASAALSFKRCTATKISVTVGNLAKMDAADNFRPRHCHVVKRPDFQGYGFNLHAEKAKPGQFIGKVDENSPAEAAGLQEGQTFSV